MPQDRYPSVRGIPAQFDSLNVGNLAPITERGSLEAGRILNVQHLFGNAVEVTSDTALEGMSIIIGVNPTKASSALLECIDATAVSQGLHSGTIQTFNAAISKSSATTTATAICQALWPGYSITAGTVTDLYGMYVYGTRAFTGGTIVGMTGVAIAANALAVSADKIGLSIGAMSGVAANRYGIKIDGQTGSAETAIACGALITQPLGGAANHALWLQSSASTEPTLLMGDVSGYIVITPPAAGLTTWTWTLPPDNGDPGEQLQTDGNGVTTWELAGSTRGVKLLEGLLEPETALERIQGAPVHRFKYDPNARGVGGDYETEFTGIVADEAPWAMMHKGKAFNPINAFGHAAAAIQALAAKIEALEAKVA